MKFYLISDNIDTVTGMRMAGIDGVVTPDRATALEALEAGGRDPELGILLITAPVMELCREEIYRLKQSSPLPLIVEVPGRDGQSDATDSIARYVKEAVGIDLSQA